MPEYNFPVFATQGGGLARQVGDSDTFIFVEASDCPGLGVGDFVPKEWDLIPANRAASEDEAAKENYGGGEYYNLI